MRRNPIARNAKFQRNTQSAKREGASALDRGLLVQGRETTRAENVAKETKLFHGEPYGLQG